MPKPHRPSSGRTNFASCIVATVFLAFIVVVLLVVYFTVFKPTDPKISVSAIRLPSFSASNNAANFTFSQYVSVKNPNRATFTHYDSSLQLLYSGNQVGFMFIPAGKIDARGTRYMAATFSVQSFPLVPSAVSSAEAIAAFPPPFTGGGYRGMPLGPAIEIESKMEMGGRVRVLHIFSHRVTAKASCRVAVSVSDGSVLGFHC